MAIKSQGSTVRVATAVVAADNITAITAAAPPVVTCGTHGIANGAIVVIQNVGGMVQLNNRAFVAANVSGTTLELKGIDATLYSPYTSGGTVTEQTMTAIGEVTSVELFDGQAADIPTTHMLSSSHSNFQGLANPGNCSIGVNHITDTGQAKLRTMKSAQANGAFSVTRSDGLVAAFFGYVRSFPASMAGPDTIVTGSISLGLAGEEAWFA